MSIPLVLQTFSIGSTQIEICVPDSSAVQQVYNNNRHNAYWAKVWPAAVGLCNFLQEHPQYIDEKNVLELAAGVGLPGLYAAGIARQVRITDREKAAVDCILQSVSHLQLSNVKAYVLNWNDAVHEPLPDALLLSDVNYEPAVFKELQQAVVYFLMNDVTVIISTPERLVAKEFVNALLKYCVVQWSVNIELNENETGVSVFVLKAK